MGPERSIVKVIGWGNPIARGGSSGDGTEWVTLALINRSPLNQGGGHPVLPPPRPIDMNNYLNNLPPLPPVV